MHLLFRIVYAAHASGTHHKLALDALRHLEDPRAELWRRLLLAHARHYLAGCKAPDVEFKDFKNHVLHPRDGYWGGAPEKARNWYGHLTDALRSQSWDTAAYCAGVLSHYYSDPIHPFHTAQSEAENSIHRAVEWSISRSYGELRALGEREFGALEVALPDGANWLAQAVCQGAEAGNRHYERLIAHYDFKRGVVRPEDGLDEVGRRVVAELLMYAAKGFAGVLDRAFAECENEPPEVSLRFATVLAGCRIPVRRLVARLADRRERRLVEAMYDELIATGTVEKSLPEDERVLRELYAAEVLARKPALEPDRRFPLPAPDAMRAPAGLAAKPARAPAALAPPAAQPTPAPMPSPPPRVPIASEPRAADAPAKPASEAAPTAAPAPVERVVRAPTSVPSVPPPQANRTRLALSIKAAAAAPAPDAISAVPAVQAAERTTRLTLDSNVVDAPAIGPKSAERLVAADIRTVADLLAADPGVVSEALGVSHVPARTVRDWQDQARLVLAMPVLRGTDAQLLVGAGFRTLEALIKTSADELAGAVQRYAASGEGSRVLRSMKAPDRSRINVWIAEAKLACVRKAA